LDVGLETWYLWLEELQASFLSSDSGNEEEKSPVFLFFIKNSS